MISTRTKLIATYLVSLFVTLLSAACNDTDRMSPSPSEAPDHTRLELPENALEGDPYSFHGTDSGSCTVKTTTGILINQGFLKSEIRQSATVLNIQLFCAPDKNAVSGYKLYTTGDLSISGNSVSGPTIRSGRIGRKGLQLVLLPLNGLEYAISASVGSKVRFEVTATYDGRIVENMLGELASR